MSDIDINWIAVIVAMLANIAIGALWYSPILFVKPWMAGVEKTIGKESFQRLHDQMRLPRVAVRTYSIAIVGAFLLSYVMGLIADYRPADTPGEGVLVGLIVWVGFVLTTSLNTVLFEGRSLMVFVINNAHQLVAFIITGAILASWQ